MRLKLTKIRNGLFLPLEGVTSVHTKKSLSAYPKGFNFTVIIRIYGEDKDIQVTCGSEEYAFQLAEEITNGANMAGASESEHFSTREERDKLDAALKEIYRTTFMTRPQVEIIERALGISPSQRPDLQIYIQGGHPEIFRFDPDISKFEEPTAGKAARDVTPIELGPATTSRPPDLMATTFRDSAGVERGMIEVPLMAETARYLQVEAIFKDLSDEDQAQYTEICRRLAGAAVEGLSSIEMEGESLPVSGSVRKILDRGGFRVFDCAKPSVIVTCKNVWDQSPLKPRSLAEMADDPTVDPRIRKAAGAAAEFAKEISENIATAAALRDYHEKAGFPAADTIGAIPPAAVWDGETREHYKKMGFPMASPVSAAPTMNSTVGTLDSPSHFGNQPAQRPEFWPKPDTVSEIRARLSEGFVWSKEDTFEDQNNDPDIVAATKGAAIMESVLSQVAENAAVPEADIPQIPKDPPLPTAEDFANDMLDWANKEIGVETRLPTAIEISQCKHGQTVIGANYDLRKNPKSIMELLIGGSDEHEKSPDSFPEGTFETLAQRLAAAEKKDAEANQKEASIPPCSTAFETGFTLRAEKIRELNAEQDDEDLAREALEAEYESERKEGQA